MAVQQTKWVLTLHTTEDDGRSQIVHLESGDRKPLDDMLADLRAEFGPDERDTLIEVPLTWQCSGEDKCMVMA